MLYYHYYWNSCTQVMAVIATSNTRKSDAPIILQCSAGAASEVATAMLLDLLNLAAAVGDS
jgi:3-polyprenyl-4-hydroxybenzoate decarboxylase